MAREGAPAKTGFRSKRQWRFAFAARKPWARAAAHASKGGKRVRYERLPERKTRPA